MSFNATEAIIELYMEKDRSTDEYIDFLSKVDLKKSKRNGPKTIHADLGKVRRKNASKGKSGALKGAAIGAGIGAAAVTTGKLVKKHKQKKEEEAAKKAVEETKSKKKGLFRKIISKESADQYNAIVDELQLRYESGELSLEDANYVSEYAYDVYIEKKKEKHPKDCDCDECKKKKRRGKKIAIGAGVAAATAAGAGAYALKTKKDLKDMVHKSYELAPKIGAAVTKEADKFYAGKTSARKSGGRIDKIHEIGHKMIVNDKSKTKAARAIYNHKYKPVK